MNLRGEEGFIDVDVAEACDEGLIEQGGFGGAFGFRETFGEIGGAQGEGLGAEAFFVRVGAEPPDPAETARVAETNFGIGDGDDQMRVWQRWRMWLFNREPAGHAEVDVEAIGVIERDDDSFGAACDACEPTAN